MSVFKCFTKVIIIPHTTSTLCDLNIILNMQKYSILSMADKEWFNIAELTHINILQCYQVEYLMAMYELTETSTETEIY